MLYQLHFQIFKLRLHWHYARVIYHLFCKTCIRCKWCINSCIYGLLVSNTSKQYHHFCEMVRFILNTISFFITGQMITYRVYKDSSSYSWRDGVILFILYIYTCDSIIPIINGDALYDTWHNCNVNVYRWLRCAIGLVSASIGYTAFFLLRCCVQVCLWEKLVNTVFFWWKWCIYEFFQFLKFVNTVFIFCKYWNFLFLQFLFSVNTEIFCFYSFYFL